MAKAPRKKRTKRSAVKRRSNPSTGTVLAFLALGAAAAGGAWWFFSKKGEGRSITKDTRSLRPSRMTYERALSQEFRLNQNRAAASEAPAKGVSGVTAPDGVVGVGSVPGAAPVETV